MAKAETFPWYLAEHIKLDEDPALVAAVIGTIARACGMSEIVSATGFGRASLYKSLSADGNPERATVLKGVKALGLRLTTAPASGTAAVIPSEP